MKFSAHPEIVPNLMELLSEQLNSLETSDPTYPVAIKVNAPEISIWDWLNANADFAQTVWLERDSTEPIAGVGAAAVIQRPAKGKLSEALTACRQVLNGNQDLKFFGGFSFDGTDSWKSFGAGKMILPRLTLSQGTLTLAVRSVEDIEQARNDLREIQFETKPLEINLPSITERSFSPPVDGWQSRVDEALSLIRSEVLEKIVLARKTKLAFSESLNPIALVSLLKQATHDCFVFCFRFEEDAFLGATPERLFLRQKDQLLSEVVAGTRMRGQTAKEDERLAVELLTSDKDQREHDIVRKSIRQKLHKFVDHLDVDSQASILRLAHKQHLRSNVHGTLKSNVDDSMLLERLHPTPAVGGYPTDNALPEIARIEPFNRGWYASPVGWVGAEEAQFVVAIRSGLVEANKLSLYSGAGIVRGSDPDQEWLEVRNKIQDFLSLFA